MPTHRTCYLTLIFGTHKNIYLSDFTSKAVLALLCNDKLRARMHATEPQTPHDAMCLLHLRRGVKI